MSMHVYVYGESATLAHFWFSFYYIGRPTKTNDFPIYTSLEEID